MINKIKEKIIKFVDIRIVPVIIAWSIFFIKFRPLLLISKYNHSNADDFWMSSTVHHVWRETHSLWEAIGQAFADAVNLWKYWDGCFMSMFIGSIPPVAIHEDYYKFTFVIIAGALIVALTALLFVILVRVCKCKTTHFLLVCPIILTIMVSMTPSAKEGFYWWVGGINYTFMFAVFLMAQAFVLEFMVSRKIYALVLGTILSFLVGVGNLLSGLVNPVVLVLEFVFFLYINKKKGLIFAIPTVAGIAGLMFNVLAPGNLIRGGSGVFDNSVLGSIWGTIEASTLFIPQFCKTAFVVLMIYVSIVIFDGMRKSTLEFKFPLPVVFTILTYLVYCAAFTPVIFAKSAWYNRCKNISFFMFVIFLIINFIYWSGWFYKKVNREKVSGKITVALIFMAAFGMIYINKDYGHQFDSFIAEYALTSGQAEDFDRRVDERVRKYYDTDITDVIVEPIDWIPPIFYWDDSCLEDVAYYYFKDSITVIE